MSIKFEGLDTFCLYPESAPCSSVAAPLQNETYSLSRYFTLDPDDPSPPCVPPGSSAGDCAACYRYGTLSICDIADLYGVAIDEATCLGCEAFNASCSSSGGYKFLSRENCSGSLIDVYLQILICASFGNLNGAAYVSVQFIYVSDPTGTPILQLGGALWASAYLYPSEVNGCTLGANNDCCPLVGPLNASCGGGVSDGASTFSLNAPPNYLGSDTGSCCGDTTVTVAAVL